MDGSKVVIEIVCCFCGENIENMEDSRCLKIYKLVGSEETQELFCHQKCLVNIVSKDIPVI
jgi:hypothetical protein